MIFRIYPKKVLIHLIQLTNSTKLCRTLNDEKSNNLLQSLQQELSRFYRISAAKNALNPMKNSY